MHRIPENDDRALRMFLRLGESDAIPQAVLDQYWEFKRLRDPYMPCDVHPDVLAWLVLSSKVEVPQDPKPNPALAIVRSGEVPYDSEIVVTWRDDLVTAKFRGYNKARDRFQAVLEGEGMEREFRMDTIVELPQMAEV